MDIALEKYGADMQAKANLMIQPERLPSIMKPELGPDVHLLNLLWFFLLQYHPVRAKYNNFDWQYC